MGSCEVCDIVGGKRGGIQAKNYIVDLKGGWVLNHCNASNAYLGYLVLSTVKHRPYFSCLSLNELKSLGFNIKWINDNLRNYWSSCFPNDSVEQIYFAYYNETPYIENLTGQKLLDSLHVHIHILPRTEAMRKICDGEMLAWDLLKIVKRFPLYLLCDNSKKMELMEYLKSQPVKLIDTHHD